MAFQGDSIFWVEVGKIVPNPFQPRKEFNEDKLKELAESIRMYGILQPLTVTRKEIQEESGAFHTEYELIAGERRLRASKIAGLEQVPVIIRSGEDTEQEKLELAIIENLQREDLNAVDRALAFQQLAHVFKLSHAQVGKKVGRSRMYVSNSIRLLALPECILNSLRLGDIAEGHARTLLMLKDRPEEQDVVYREIMLKKLSVREVERIARKIATDKVRKKKWTNTDAHLIEIEREFTNTLGTRVQIAKTDFGGKLTIDYFSDEDLEKLLHLVKSQGKITEMDSVPKHDQHVEQQTVIQEMSPEATILAKVSASTPLEMVPAEVGVSSGQIEQEHKISEMSIDSVVTKHTEDIVEESKEITVDEPEEVSEYTEESIQITRSDTLEDSEVESGDDSVHDTSDHGMKEGISGSEFSFITNHPAEARKEDVVLRSDYEQKMFQTKEQNIEKHAPEINDAVHSVTQAQSDIGPVDRENIEKKQELQHTDESDDGLYSIKSFSL